jgi:hypothetical protein
VSSISDLPFGPAITIANGDSVLRTGVAATLICAQFSSVSKSASAGVPVLDSRTGLSVRFIRHA